MIGCFAIIPDKDERIAAMFEDLEDAMDWGLEAYGNNAFTIRFVEMARIEKAENHGASGPV